MDYKKSLEDIEKILTDLIEENKTIPVIVEGEKDEEALRKLGLTGEILRFNTGMSVSDFCDKTSSKYKKVIMLSDWDRKGGHLCSLIKKNIESRVKCNIKYRKLLAKNSTTRTVEGLPSWINTIKEKTSLNV